MKLSFFGGAQALTGSCYLLEVGDQSILIDCGIQQGRDEYNSNNLEFYASRIGHTLVTHAHVDHTGRLPLLVQEGYYGRIICTPTTKKLMSIILKETADGRMHDAWWRNIKGQRGGVSPVEPLFSMTDVVSTMQQVETEEFNHIFELCPGVKVRFIEAGHMPGAASIEIWATEGEETRKIVFSGDLGNKDLAFAGNPRFVDEADFVVLDGTCGDKRNDPPVDQDDLADFIEVLDVVLAHSGNVLIPLNAVGRLQEVLATLAKIKKEKRVKSVPNFKVYLDSFLAEESVRLFEGDTTTDLGVISVSDIQGEKNPFLFDDLVLCKTEAESKALNYDRTPKVILAGSGMCERGRMKHHLKHNLWRKECAVVMVGFVGEGSFARRLLDGVRSVRLFGEEIVVRAKVFDFKGTSSHGDQDQLLEWMGTIEEKPRHTFVVHGTEEATKVLSEKLEAEGYHAHSPRAKEVYDLLANCIVEEGIDQEERAMSVRGRSYSLPYIRLQDNIRELDTLLREGRWHSGEEFEDLSRGVRALIESWPKDKHI